MPALAQVKKVDVQGVQNFNQIDAVFACGGATDANGVANLKKQGFASIISFRLPTEQGVNEEEAAVKTTRHQVRAPAAQRRDARPEGRG